MQAVILCAGEGVRLRPLTNKIPKVMLPIGGKPLLYWHIEHIKKYGIEEVFINCHYLPEAITGYFGDGSQFGVKIKYSLEKKLLGTGGALVNFKKYLYKRFLLLYGDVFTRLNIKNMAQFHKNIKALVTIAVHFSSHPLDSDLVKTDANMRVEKFYFKPHQKKKPNSNLGLAAIYIVEPEALSFLPDRVPFDFVKDFLEKLRQTNNLLFCYNTDELIRDIGTLKRFREIKTLIEA